jgi:hypothetical protein
MGVWSFGLVSFGQMPCLHVILIIVLGLSRLAFKIIGGVPGVTAVKMKFSSTSSDICCLSLVYILVSKCQRQFVFSSKGSLI